MGSNRSLISITLKSSSSRASVLMRATESAMALGLTHPTLCCPSLQRPPTGLVSCWGYPRLPRYRISPAKGMK